MHAFALVLANSDGRLGPILKKTAAECGNALACGIEGQKGLADDYGAWQAKLAASF